MQNHCLFIEINIFFTVQKKTGFSCPFPHTDNKFIPYYRFPDYLQGMIESSDIVINNNIIIILLVQKDSPEGS